MKEIHSKVMLLDSRGNESRITRCNFTLKAGFFSYAKQKGITLIELMIALTLSLALMAAMMAIIVNNVKTSTENIQMMMLNQELRASMSFITAELRGHGYSSSSDTTALNTFRSDGCLIYSYDVEGEGNTVRGFRLDDNELEWCAAGASINSCNTCTASWQPLTTKSVVTITDFIVDTSNSVDLGSVLIRRLDVTLTGQRQLSGGVVERTIKETIRVRNEAM